MMSDTRKIQNQTLEKEIIELFEQIKLVPDDVVATKYISPIYQGHLNTCKIVSELLQAYNKAEDIQDEKNKYIYLSDIKEQLKLQKKLNEAQLLIIPDLKKIAKNIERERIVIVKNENNDTELQQNLLAISRAETIGDIRKAIDKTIQTLDKLLSADDIVQALFVAFSEISKSSTPLTDYDDYFARLNLFVELQNNSYQKFSLFTNFIMDSFIYSLKGYNIEIVDRFEKLKLEKNVLYIKKGDGCHEYTVINPSNKKVLGNITYDELHDQGIPTELNRETLELALPKILEITHKKNHTTATGINFELYNKYYEMRYDLKKTSESTKAEKGHQLATFIQSQISDHHANNLSDFNDAFFDKVNFTELSNEQQTISLQYKKALDNLNSNVNVIGTSILQIKNDYSALGKTKHKPDIERLIRKVNLKDARSPTALIAELENAFNAELNKYTRPFFAFGKEKDKHLFIDKINKAKDDFHYPRLLAITLQALYLQYPDYTRKDRPELRGLINSVTMPAKDRGDVYTNKIPLLINNEEKEAYKTFETSLTKAGFSKLEAYRFYRNTLFEENVIDIKRWPELQRYLTQKDFNSLLQGKSDITSGLQGELIKNANSLFANAITALTQHAEAMRQKPEVSNQLSSR